MNVAVIVPVGPGHDQVAKEATLSVQLAWKHSTGPFEWLDLLPITDYEGFLGRSRARNTGMDFADISACPPDYYFFLDADDTMELEAFALVDLDASATFGAVKFNGRVVRFNRHPLDKALLWEYGVHGTLTMGFFVRASLALRFDHTLDVGEDFDFYCRLPDFTKRKEPLVNIGYDLPSAGGPRSSAGCQWEEVCAGVMKKYEVNRLKGDET